MNVAHNSDREVTRSASFWLELRIDGVARTFELDADETRAVAVGSLLRADLRIDRPGVAPVHFHIEREHEALWIVPAYGAKDLRVNAARLTGPKRLDGQAVIEFSNVRVDARILDGGSAVMRTSSAQELSEVWAPGSEHQASRLFGHLVLTKETRHAEKSPERGAILTAPVREFYSSTIASSEQQTVSFAAMQLEPVPEQATAVVHPFHAIPEASENESPPTLRTSQRASMASGEFAHDATLSEQAAQDTIEMAPFWMAAQSPEPEMARQAGSRVSDSIPARPILPVRGPTAQLRASEFNEPYPVHMAETTYMEPMSIADCESARGRERRTQCPLVSAETGVSTHEMLSRNWLARVGMFSTRRPLLVWLVGTAAVFALAAAFALASKHLRNARASQRNHSTGIAHPVLTR